MTIDRFQKLTAATRPAFAATLRRTRYSGEGADLLTEQECADVVEVLSLKEVKDSSYYARRNLRPLYSGLSSPYQFQEEWTPFLNDLESARYGYKEMVEELFEASGLCLPSVDTTGCSAPEARERIIEAVREWAEDMQHGYEERDCDTTQETRIAAFSVPVVVAIHYRIRLSVLDAVSEEPLTIYSESGMASVAKKAQGNLSDLMDTYLNSKVAEEAA